MSAQVIYLERRGPRHQRGYFSIPDLRVVFGAGVVFGMVLGVIAWELAMWVFSHLAWM